VFILSLNDRPEVRQIFKEFNIYKIKTTYTLASGTKAKQAGEVLISNKKLKGL
jgi:DNA adenine methylase